MKILAGASPDYQGTVKLDGRMGSISRIRRPRSRRGERWCLRSCRASVSSRSPRIFFSGRQPTTTIRPHRLGRAMRRQAAAQLAELEIDVDVDRRLGNLPARSSGKWSKSPAD